MEITKQRARALHLAFGLDPTVVSLDTWMAGLKVELEHGVSHADCPDATNVTDDDLVSTAKIVIAHLVQFSDYYTHLAEMERVGELEWKGSKPPSVFKKDALACQACECVDPSRLEFPQEQTVGGPLELKRSVTFKQARLLSDMFHLDTNVISVRHWQKGLQVELEHGLKKGHPKTDVTGDSLVQTAKITLAHIIELPDYYQRLEKMVLSRHRRHSSGQQRSIFLSATKKK